MMPKVELIYDADCPNVQDTRTQLRHAFSEVGLAAEWQEWDRADAASPAYARSYGSPTILVDGTDVAGASPSDPADCCRLYTVGPAGFQGVPPAEMIAAALRRSIAHPAAPDGPKQPGGIRSWIVVLPAAMVALLPNVACPACWPVYAGLLSSLGLPFLMDAAYLLPLTALFVILAVGALALRAKRRRGYGPLVLGLLAATVVIVGKFLVGSDPAMYGGVALLLAASIWDAWPTKGRDVACPACERGGPLRRIGPFQNS